MPFYFRKSVSAGPFRFNFSKGGVGVSVGVRGLRIGTGPRGHYVHAGASGFYYRATIGKAGGSKPQAYRPSPTVKPGPTVPEAAYNDVQMIEVDSGDVMLMRDAKFSDLLEEVNAKGRQIKASSTLGWAVGLLGLLLTLAMGAPGFLFVLLAFPGWAMGRWLDSYRRSTVLYYDLGNNSEAAYRQLTDGFDGLRACDGKWHIEAGGAVQDLTTWKRNAGASHLVKKKGTTLAYALPSVIKSNITPPALHVGKQVIYFLPDVALVEDGNKMGAVSYADLKIRWQDSRFIEDGNVPRDAKIVDQTWQHPNKSGGPDRRFKSNRQIPICLYETMHLQSDNGVNELLEFSQTGRVKPFVAGCRSLIAARDEAPEIPAITFEGQPAVSSMDSAVPSKRRGVKLVFGLLLGLGFLGFVVARNETPKTSSSYSSSTATAATQSDRAGTQTAVQELPASSTPTLLMGNASGNIETDSEATLPPAENATPFEPPPPEADAFESLLAAIPTREPDTPTAIAPPPPTPKFGYVTQPIQLREGPGPAYLAVASVAQNVQVAIIEQENGWTRVSAGPDAIGWLPKEIIGKGPIPVKKQQPAVKKKPAFPEQQWGR